MNHIFDKPKPAQCKRCQEYYYNTPRRRYGFGTDEITVRMELKPGICPTCTAKSLKVLVLDVIESINKERLELNDDPPSLWPLEHYFYQPHNEIYTPVFHNAQEESKI